MSALAAPGDPIPGLTDSDSESPTETSAANPALKPTIEPIIEVNDGQVLIDGVPEGATLIEEDIIFPEDFYTRAGVATNLWPGGVVPYEFSEGFDPGEQNAMLTAMAEWEAVAAVDFRPRNGETEFLLFHNNDGYPENAGVHGDVGAPQPGYWRHLYLHDLTHFEVVHQLGHSLGYWHEQQRPDRDAYVQIDYTNIGRDYDQNSYATNFNIPPGAEAYGPYDFDSVMHSAACAYSVCPQSCSAAPAICRPITVLPPYDADWQYNIGQRSHLSFWDQRVMSFLYPYADWRFVDLNHGGGDDGTFFDPYLSLSRAIDETPDGGTLWFLEPDAYSAVGVYSRPMTWRAGHLPVVLGG